MAASCQLGMFCGICGGLSGIMASADPLLGLLVGCSTGSAVGSTMGCFCNNDPQCQTVARAVASDQEPATAVSIPPPQHVMTTNPLSRRIIQIQHGGPILTNKSAFRPIHARELLGRLPGSEGVFPLGARTEVGEAVEVSAGTPTASSIYLTRELKPPHKNFSYNIRPLDTPTPAAQQYLSRGSVGTGLK